MHIVFTATEQTADQYIEKTAIKRKKDSYIRVATSDMVERMIVLSQGATIMTADNFRGIIEAAEKEIRERL
jgi:predicted RNA-binding protein with PIN domain